MESDSILVEWNCQMMETIVQMDCCVTGKFLLRIFHLGKFHRENSSYGKFLLWKIPPMENSTYGKFHPWKIQPMENSTYGKFHLRKSPYGKFHLWKIPPAENSTYGQFNLWKSKYENMTIIYIPKIKKAKFIKKSYLEFWSCRNQARRFRPCLGGANAPPKQNRIS